MLTDKQVEERFITMDKILKGYSAQIAKLSSDLNSKANLTDLNRSINNLGDLVREQSLVIQDLESKLAKVILPTDTRYYLEQGEVQTFQSNFNTLKAMMTKFDKLYKNLVSFQSNAKV